MPRLPVTEPSAVDIENRRCLHTGFISLEALTLRFERFDGTMSPPILREIVHLRHASAVLPYDPVRDEVVLLEQFRPPLAVVGERGWDVEIVAGLIEDGETAEDVARRECVEECGLTVGDMERIAMVYVSPGSLTQAVSLFCGRVDASQAGGIHGLPGEAEDIRAFRLAADVFADRGRNGDFANATILMAAQWFALNHDRLKKSWREQDRV